MQEKWTEFLTKLGCELTSPTPDELQPCPLHPTLGHTLRLSRDACDPDQGRWLYTCNESRCNFSGDAVMLLAQVRKISLDEAFALFLPGQEFASVLVEDFTGTQLDEYRNSRSNQLQISNYLLQSQNAIRTELKGTKLRNKMADLGILQYSSSTLNDVPKTLGLLIPEGMPPILRELKSHSKAHCALYDCIVSVAFCKLSPDALVSHHKGIKVVTGRVCHLLEVTGIDEIRTDLEGLDAIP